MIYYFLAWLVGQILRYGYLWTITTKSEFSTSKNLKEGALYVVFGIGVAFIFKNMNAANWIVYVIVAILSALAPFVISKAGNFLFPKK